MNCYCLTFRFSGGALPYVLSITVRCNWLLGDRGSGARYNALTCSTGTGRCNSGLMNRLARAAKMIGVKPITEA